MVDPIKTTGEIVSKKDVQDDPAQDPNKIQVNIEELKKHLRKNEIEVRLWQLKETVLLKN